MEEGKLSPEVRLFIREHIHSVEQLEVLLLLRATGREWTALAVSQEIRTERSSAEARLKDLESRGFLTRSGEGYAYKPKTEELGQKVSALASAYAERRYTVINQIFSNPVDRIRTFAEAFELRKKKDGDDG